MPMSRQRRKVLIVDDEEDLTWSLSHSLTHFCPGLEVSCLHNGLEAFQYLKRRAVDLLITDLRMPGMNGLELLKEVKKYRPQTKVIVITAFSSQELEREIYENGGNLFLEKPFDIGELRWAILKLLDGPQDASRDSISGRIREMLRLSRTSQSSWVLRVQEGQKRGNIYFSQGQIWHAESGAVRGEPALRRILEWKTGVCRMEPQTHPPARTIFKNPEALI